MKDDDEGSDEEQETQKRSYLPEQRRQPELSTEHMVSVAIWWIEVLLLDKCHENELFSGIPRSSIYPGVFCLSGPRDFSGSAHCSGNKRPLQRDPTFFQFCPRLSAFC